MDSNTAVLDGYKEPCPILTSKPKFTTARTSKWIVGWCDVGIVLVLLHGILMPASAHTMPREQALESNGTMKPVGGESEHVSSALDGASSEQHSGDTDIGVSGGRILSDILKLEEHSRDPKTTKHKRSAPQRRRPVNNRTRGASTKWRKRSRKSQKRQVIHFTATTNTSLGGERTVNGTLIPNEGPYKFWETRSNRIFRYDQETGKVTVRLSGIFIVYSKILYYGRSIRRSYGAFVNNDVDPFVEAMSFPRLKQNANGGPTHEYESYSHLGAIAVRYLRANDQIYLKATGPYKRKAIVTQPSLTYWGIAKL